MEVTRERYRVTGWGVGELAVADGLVVGHELPSHDREGPAVRRCPVAPPAGARAFVPCLGPSRDPVVGPPPDRVLGPPPDKGAASPPAVTLPADRERPCAGFVTDLVARFTAHLGGCETTYTDVAVDLSWCTPFQEELARALLEVPWGEIVSYGELAALAGRPGAARAAGSFCARNRFALIFPCHRVVGATGIGGYGADGLGLKRRLLALEGVEL